MGSKRFYALTISTSPQNFTSRAAVGENLLEALITLNPSLQNLAQTSRIIEVTSYDFEGGVLVEGERRNINIGLTSEDIRLSAEDRLAAVREHYRNQLGLVD